MDLRAKAPVAYGLEFVGLSPKTPLTICTQFYGADEEVRVRRADDTEPGRVDNMRYVEIRSPRNLEYVPMHRHSFYEIALFREGQVRNITHELEHPVRPGDVLIFVPGFVHAYEGVISGCHTDMYLLPDWLQEELRILWGAGGLVQFLLAHALFDKVQTAGYLWLRCTAEETATWEAELRVIEEEYRLPKPSIVTINGCFLKILGILDRVFLREKQHLSMPIREEAWKAAEEVERYVTQAVPFDPDALAAHVAMSTRNFSRVFRETTGRSPFDYYQHRRIAHARRRLLEAGPSITTIAHELGFSDAAHFSRLFKQFEGVSPRAFRNAGQQAQPGD